MATALALTAFVSMARAVDAPRRGARLTWARGAQADRCVGVNGLTEDVKARLGYDPFALPPALSVEGAVVRASPGFRAELVLRDAAGAVLGTRQLSSAEPDCRSLGEAVAVAITVAIDPEASGVPTIATEAPPLGEPEPPLVAAAPSPAPTTTRARGHASLTAGASAGLVPGIGVVASLRASRRFGVHWEAGASAHFWPESRTDGLGFALTTLALEGCYAPWASLEAIRWCGGVHFGLFHVFVHAPELAPVDIGMFPWGAAESGPALSIPLGSAVHLEIGASALVPFVRRQALVRGQAGATWEQSGVGGRADVGLGTVF